MTVIVELRDGRQIDISGMTAAQADEHLRQLGVTLGQVKGIIHHIPARSPR